MLAGKWKLTCGLFLNRRGLKIVGAEFLQFGEDVFMGQKFGKANDSADKVYNLAWLFSQKSQSFVEPFSCLTK